MLHDVGLSHIALAFSASLPSRSLSLVARSMTVQLETSCLAAGSFYLYIEGQQPFITCHREVLSTKELLLTVASSEMRHTKKSASKETFFS